MIDLSMLNSLRAVDTHGSVVAAAEARGFTPSAISQQIKRLERQAGVPLLERVGRGVILTVHGRQLVDDGTRLVRDLERLESELHRSIETVAGRIRLSAFSTAMRGLVAPVVRRLLGQHPDLELALEEHEPWDTIDLVASGRCEMGIVHSWGQVPIDVPEHVERISFASDIADVIVHREHHLATRSVLTPADLIDEDWIATPENTICRQWLRRMHDGTGRLPRIAHESMEFESHLALVGAGLGIALVPRLGRAALGDDLVAVAVTDPVPTRDVIALHRRTMAASPAIRAILDELVRSSA